MTESLTPRVDPHEIDPVRLPSLDELGRDLLSVSGAERVLSIARPLVCLGMYGVLAAKGWWVPAIVAVGALMFITYVSTTHDLVHRTLGFSRKANEFWLCVLELMVLRSGHAFRRTHLEHHRHFPEEDDVEGRVARMTWWRALLDGVGNQARLFIWASGRARKDERRWMWCEAAGVIAIWGASIACVGTRPELLVYCVTVMVGSWVYPFATVWVPHRAEGKTALEQTHLLRGRWVPELFLQHTYHLEHHLYPSVSSHRWPELGRRLDAYFEERDVKAIRTW